MRGVNGPAALTKSIVLDTLDPRQFPESGTLWNSGTIKQYPKGRHGLEYVDFLGGCAHGTYGPYVNWLRATHPNQAHLFLEKVTLEPPTTAAELFNRKGPARQRIRNDLRIRFLDKIMQTDISLPRQVSWA